MTLWTISENIKFITFLLVNRSYFKLEQKTSKFRFKIKLSQYINTGRSVSHCKRRLSFLSSFYKGNALKMIE